MSDILEVVAGYAPDADPEWTAERQETVLAAILGAAPEFSPGVEIPLQVGFRPARRRRRVTAIAASAAAFATAASAIIAVTLHGAEQGPVLAAGAAWDPPPGLSDTAPIDSGKYGYAVVQEGPVDAGGTMSKGSTTYRSYVSPTGRIAVIKGDNPPRCLTYGAHGGDSFDTPSEAFFAKLPTDVDALETYFRSHVQGSSSLDEAVFVAVGDALRTTDALASPKLKAAMLAMLSRTGGVVLHDGVQDHLGRPAIRADFVNQAIRPDDVQSLYFDPTTFAVLEQADGLPNGQPSTYDGPSPAYTAHAGPGVDPDQLTGPGFVTVISHSAVVDSLPACAR